MEFSYSASGSFSASHEEEFCFLGSRLHGHKWRVTATIMAIFDPIKGRLTKHSDLQQDLVSVLGELNGRHLNDMLPGTHTMPENIGVWVLERLNFAHKRLYEVEVEVEGQVARVFKEVRT